MEAGNRCYDDRVPEEVNRRVIDHSSSVLLPYTERSRENLLAEGIPGSRIYVTGNPIKQVIDRFAPQIAQSRALEEYGLSAGKYFLATAHRSENVDNDDRLRSLVGGLRALHRRVRLPGRVPAASAHPLAGGAAGIELAGEGIRLPPAARLLRFHPAGAECLLRFCRTAARCRKRPVSSECPTSPCAM